MKEPNPVYINYKVQDSYPSGSTISYLSGRFYIMETKEKLQKNEFNISSLTKLSDLSPDFRHQKIESVSLIKGKRQLLVVADDDMGSTKLFRLRF